jgi:4-diphosphocytidyl-2-C-methyl-D-erythritol kinase
VLVPLDWGDDLEIDVAPAARTSVSLVLESGDAPGGGGVPADASNLAARAAERFLEGARLTQAVQVRLSKRIPAAAGLGGGSSDAAAVLRELARRFPDAYEREGLARLALALGADVPFFLGSGAAVVRGIGDEIEPLAGLRPRAVLLVHPGTPLATAEVFGAFDALGAGPPSGIDPDRGSRLASAWSADPLPQGRLEPLLANDLEPAAVRLCPPVARLRRSLRAAGAQVVGLSGSGPTLFGVFAGRGEAEAALARAGFESPVWARVASTLESR